MVTVALALLAWSPQDSARKTVESIMSHYKALNTYSSTVESHDASGLFPGNYEQTLRFRRGGRFELIVTKKSDYVPKADVPGMAAPDYFSNGKAVLARQPNGSTQIRPIDAGPNVSPGWEVSGGPVLSWLLDSRTAKFYLTPPMEAKMEYSWGERTTWEGEAVREILLEMTAGDIKRRASLFIEPAGPGFVGQEYVDEGKRKWVRYRDRKDNPSLPNNLGDHPK